MQVGTVHGFQIFFFAAPLVYVQGWKIFRRDDEDGGPIKHFDERLSGRQSISLVAPPRVCVLFFPKIVGS
jgi:hypothetical protein